MNVGTGLPGAVHADHCVLEECALDARVGIAELIGHHRAAQSAKKKVGTIC